MENQLWDQGLLGDCDPQILLNMMVYLFGQHFALRRIPFKNSQVTMRMTNNGRCYLEYREVSLVFNYVNVVYLFQLFIKLQRSGSTHWYARYTLRFVCVIYLIIYRGLNCNVIHFAIYFWQMIQY